MRAETSRKRDAIHKILLSRAGMGRPLAEVVASTKGYSRKTLAELQELSRQAYREYQEGLAKTLGIPLDMIEKNVPQWLRDCK